MRAAALLLLLAAQDARIPFDPAVHEATKTYAFEEFLIVPVRVHLLRSKEEEALNTRLQEGDVRRIFGKVNRIWNRAGLALAIESILVEDAERPEGFDEQRLADYRQTRPAKGRDPALIHVYYVHRLPTNGVFMGREAIFVKDTAALREAKGGVDEPIPRVTSHEIGHAMGLPHRQDVVNLMASGTTGWSLNDAESAVVRAWAAETDGVLAPAAALEKGHAELLSRLPGESPLKERAKAAIEKK